MRLFWTSILGLATVALAGGCGGSLNGPGGGSGGVQGGSGVAGARGATQATGGDTGGAGFRGGSLDASYGAGGSAGANDGRDGGSSCIATFSGGLSSTVGCTASLFFEPVPGGTTSFSLTITPGSPLAAHTAFPGTDYAWILQVIVPGVPRTGTFHQGPGTYGRDNVSVPMGDPPRLGTPDWLATFEVDAGAMVGSLTVTITSVGPVTVASDYEVYDSPHGTASATLVDTVAGMPDIIQTVTF